MQKLTKNCTHLTCQQSNAQSSPRKASTLCELRVSRCSSWIQKRQRTRGQTANICWINKNTSEFQKNIFFGFIDCVDHNKQKFFKIWEYQTTLPATWEICIQIKKEQLELGVEQRTGSKEEKEYIKAVYCHPAYLTYIQCTSREMLGWMKHQLKSRQQGDI